MSTQINRLQDGATLDNTTPFEYFCQRRKGIVKGGSPHVLGVVGANFVFTDTTCSKRQIDTHNNIQWSLYKQRNMSSPALLEVTSFEVGDPVYIVANVHTLPGKAASFYKQGLLEVARSCVYYPENNLSYDDGKYRSSTGFAHHGIHTYMGPVDNSVTSKDRYWSKTRQLRFLSPTGEIVETGRNTMEECHKHLL